METAALRTLTAEACQRMQGKLWPNGLGFDRRGWSFFYSERYPCWWAGRGLRHAAGPTPEQAQQNAKRGT